MHTESSGKENDESFAASLVLGDISDLTMVYQHLEQQFPAEEIYKLQHLKQMMNNSKYKILLYRRDSDNALIGYATTYSMQDCEIVWLDLFAILPDFQGKGYGHHLFQAVYQKYCGASYTGVLLCAEMISKDNPALARVQRRRLRFYEDVGAYRLHTEFELPVEDGSLPMYLLFKPDKGVTTLSRKTQFHMLNEMFEYCYCHIKHSPEVLAKFRKTITDENFRRPQRAIEPELETPEKK